MSTSSTDTPEHIYVEKGRHDQLLLLVFNSDFHHPLVNRKPFQFFELTARLECSRIHCRDRHFIFYHDGLDEQHPNVQATADFLRERIREFAPAVTIALGASSGAYAALVFGHLLGLDHVHALGPVTCLLPKYLEEHAREDTELRWHRYRALWASPNADWNLFDLAQVLAVDNGRTKYYLHYCEGYERDRMASERLKGLPGVTLCPYDCDHHFVVVHMIRENLLQLLFFPEKGGTAVGEPAGVVATPDRID